MSRRKQKRIETEEAFLVHLCRELPRRSKARETILARLCDMSIWCYHNGLEDGFDWRAQYEAKVAS